MNTTTLYTWFDPEKARPVEGQKIIFVDKVGLFWGEFHTTTKDWQIYVDGSPFDKIKWANIYKWIPYPEEFQK